MSENPYKSPPTRGEKGAESQAKGKRTETFVKGGVGCLLVFLVLGATAVFLGGTVSVFVGSPIEFFGGKVKVNLGGLVLVFLLGGLFGLAFERRKRKL